MAFDVSTVYSPKLDQPFKYEALTNELNNDGMYDFTDAQSVVILTTSTKAFVPYDRTQSLEDAISDISLVENTSETYTISQYKKNVEHLDFFDELEQPAITVAKHQMAVIKEQFVPMVDAYRLGVLGAAATANGQVVTATADALADYYTCQNYLTNAESNRQDRIVFVNTIGSKAIKLDDRFVAYTAEQLKNLRSGEIGRIDGALVKEVPDNRMPTGFNAIFVDKNAVFGPRGIKRVQIKDAPGKPGKNIETYARYDLFVRDQNQNAIAAIKA